MKVSVEWWSDNARRASDAQLVLGPNTFPEGMIVVEWQEVQERYIKDRQLKMDSGRRTRELIKRSPPHRQKSSYEDIYRCNSEKYVDL